jgi:Ice-binding-like
MKLVKSLSVSAFMLAVVLGGCNKDEKNYTSPLASAGSPLDNSLAIAAANSSNGTKTSKPVSKTLAVVNLGVAGNFAILSKSGITDVYKSSVTGDIGTSPITGAAIHLTCAEVSGIIYTVDATGPLPCRVINASRLTTAVLNMQTAYTDAAGRSNPDYLNLGAGSIGGKTLTAGLYKFTSNVVIPTNVTISGSSTDVWIFQIAGTLNMSSAVKIILKGGAQAKNIFWQASGNVTLGTTSHFEGSILSQTAINMKTGSSINGRMLAQTAVTLEMSTVVKPK